MTLLFKKYSWAIYLALIFFGTYFLAKIFLSVVEAKIRGDSVGGAIASGTSLTVASRSPQGEAYENYRVIFERNIFDSTERAPEPEPVVEKEAEPLDLNAEAVKTSLPIQLISTVSVGDGTDKRSSATVVSKGKPEEIYTVGGEKTFHEGVKLLKILPERIEFINGRRLEFAEIENFGNTMTTRRPTSRLNSRLPSRGTTTSGAEDGIKEVSSNNYVIDRAEIDNALSNLGQFITQIRAVPYNRGNVSGLQLKSIRRNSLFSKLGLRRGDILEQINGQAVDFQKGMQLFNQLKDVNQITIGLVRRGKKMTLDYQIQ